MVPFRNNKKGCKEAQFQLGYKGYIQLAIRSGQYKKLNVLAIDVYKRQTMKSETMKKVTEGIVRGHVLDTAGCTDKAADELEKV